MLHRPYMDLIWLEYPQAAAYVPRREAVFCRPMRPGFRCDRNLHKRAMFSRTVWVMDYEVSLEQAGAQRRGYGLIDAGGGGHLEPPRAARARLHTSHLQLLSPSTRCRF